jgi:alpha,alpha-trehalase
MGGTPWQLVFEGHDPGQEGLREALCTLGNGYVATRGAAPEADADGVHYPGTYLAGVFNRLDTTIGEVTVSNESMVNQPNWLVLRLRTPDGDWLTPDTAEVEGHRLELDLRRGVLTRTGTWVDAAGRRTHLTQRRIVHMESPHLAALETTIVAEDWSGLLTVRSMLDGRVENALVERYKDLDRHHHDVVRKAPVDDETVLLQVETTQSRVRVAEVARTRVHRDGRPVDVERTLLDEDGWIGHDLTVPVTAGEAITIEKVVGIHSSRDRAITEAAEQAVRAVRRAGAFDELLQRHVFQWAELWDRFHLDFRDGDDDTQRILNLHIFHTLQTVSPNTIDRDVGVPARGLHGEAYRGHIFWDEVFVLPFLTLRLPALTRSLLMYRYWRLGEACAAAAAVGHAGAMYPWQSGSDGSEQSQRLHLNPRSGRWLPDHSHLQRHIDHAIAFDVIHYAQTTDDVEFLRYQGGPMLIEIARFLASLTSYDRALDRYRIRGVMGPDEFHVGYPDHDVPGLDDNAYTNVMTVWVLMRVRELLDGLPAPHRRDLLDHRGLTRKELDDWEAISRRMHVPFHADGIISQFAGYEDLEELDWDAYRARYGDLQRMDRILEAEGDTPDRYKVSKQADVLMLFYLLTAGELTEIFDRLGYDWDPALIPRTIDYYLQRTSHGSTLSGLVHSWVLARSDRAGSWELFQQALRSDVADVQGGTTAEGIHLGAMAGSLDLVQRGYTGVVVRQGVLWLEPALPSQVRRLAVPLHYRGHRLHVVVEDGTVQVSAPPSRLAPVTVGYRGRTHELAPGDTVAFPLEPRRDERLPAG